MEQEKIALRIKPKLEFLFGKTDFEIRNDEDGQINGTYPYEKIESIEWRKKRTNWFVTILSYIFTFFFDGPTGDVYKDKQKLIINTENKALDVFLAGCDIKMVGVVVEKLNEKIKTYTQQNPL